MYGVVQLFVLSSPSRTIRWPSILFGFVAGMSASASAALLTERGSAVLFAAALHRTLSSITVFDSYTLDPIVEELCKVLPLLLVLLIPRVRTRLGFSDIVLICAALGSGFRFHRDHSSIRVRCGCRALERRVLAYQPRFQFRRHSGNRRHSTVLAPGWSDISWAVRTPECWP